MTDAPHPFLIDCDTGRDDALAIWCALALEMPLSGVMASYGNVTLDKVTENCLRVLALGGRQNIPVYPGASVPSHSTSAFESVVIPRQEKSGNGLCNIELPRGPQKPTPQMSVSALAATLRSITADKWPVDYVIIGPATNFSNLCSEMGPEIKKHVRRVFMMGGKLSPMWDTMPGGDFNLVCDPFAVQNILRAGFEIHFIPMNFTWPIVLDVDELKALRATTTLAHTAKSLMIAHAKYFAPEPVFRFHDPCAVLAMNSLDKFRKTRISIETTDGTDFARLKESHSGLPAYIFEGDADLRKSYLSQILSALGLSGIPQTGQE